MNSENILDKRGLIIYSLDVHNFSPPDVRNSRCKETIEAFPLIKFVIVSIKFVYKEIKIVRYNWE